MKNNKPNTADSNEKPLTNTGVRDDAARKMQYDAFQGEAYPGDLQDPADIDLLIVFLIEKLDGLTKSQILDAVLVAGSANYLQTAQCVSNLIARGAILSEGDDAPLHITQNGRRALAVLGNNLPRSVGEKTLRAALRAQSRRRNLEANSATIEELDDGYYLSLSVQEKGEVLFSLRLFVADKIQAQNMRNRFLTEPGAVFDAITAALM